MIAVIRFRCRVPEPPPDAGNHYEQRHGRCDPFFASHFPFPFACKMFVASRSSPKQAPIDLLFRSPKVGRPACTYAGTFTSLN
jgi:hypothetical protein